MGRFLFPREWLRLLVTRRRLWIVQSNHKIKTPTDEAYNELQSAYEHFNQRLFGGELPYCLITMQREKHTFGYFSHKRFVHRTGTVLTDEIAMNPAYFATSQTLEVLQTIVHEMVHLWQFHFGKPGRRGYHNVEWGTKMEAVGLMPSNTGKPGGAKTGERMADYPIPDGPFLDAAAELLDSGFRISWMDRYAYPQRWPEPQPSDPGMEPPGVVPVVAEPHTPVRPSSPTPAVTLGSVIVSIASHDRSNRAKYRCPCCGAQVWGKPKLKILCGNEGCEGAEFGIVATG